MEWYKIYRKTGLRFKKPRFRVTKVVQQNRIGIKRARVYASAENLFYWSAKKGFNPLGGITGPTGNSSYTHARTINFGINFGL